MRRNPAVHRAALIASAIVTLVLASPWAAARPAAAGPMPPGAAAGLVPPGAAAGLVPPGTAARPALPGTGCPAFPADNVWNTPVTGLPVDRRSARWLRSMAAGSTDLHPDFGPSGGTPYGIPWQITAPHPGLVNVRFRYAAQSDHGPYPFSARTPIEGGRAAGGDRHALMVDPANCRL